MAENHQKRLKRRKELNTRKNKINSKTAEKPAFAENNKNSQKQLKPGKIIKQHFFSLPYLRK